MSNSNHNNKCNMDIIFHCPPRPVMTFSECVSFVNKRLLTVLMPEIHWHVTSIANSEIHVKLDIPLDIIKHWSNIEEQDDGLT